MSKISLRAARINAGFTLNEVSEKTGYCLDTLSRYEKGKSQPRWNTFLELCRLYQIPADDVFIPNE